ncbi:uncharacterized protein LOC143378697 isoform X2 [Andrena cerasifolii]|uniref:uncharacterized protein LOC143378697 isoform X2 n=1 Tax=Andrena cerasifolii TaxID=2819439 RepID=UPI004037F889
MRIPYYICLQENMRKRCVNFTQQETELLIDIVTKYKNIIESKRTNAMTWKQKSDTWDKIQNDFNACTSIVPRSSKTLRLKYESIKREIRKKYTAHKYDVFTDGSSAENSRFLLPFEEKVLAILRSTFDNNTYSDVVNEDMQVEYVEDEDTETYIPAMPQMPAKKQTMALQMPGDTDEIDVKIEDMPRPSCNHEMQNEPQVNGNTERRTDTYEKLLKLKIECLELQKQLLTEEKEAKLIINQLTIQNLKADLELKQCKLQIVKTPVER